MAENLMKRMVPYEERKADPGFGYAGGFQDILTAYNGLNHRGANVRYHDNQQLLQDQITHLTNLKKELEEDEDEFFSMFGIRGNNKKESFTKLQNKLEEWDATRAVGFINDSSVGNEFYKALQIAKKWAVFSEIPQQDWDMMLTETFDNEQTKELLRNNKELDIAGLLNQLLGSKQFSSGKGSTLIANLSVSLDDNDNIKITSKKGKITPQMQLKLVSLLEEYLDKKIKKTSPAYNFKRIFNDIFKTLGIDETGQKYILMALNKKKKVLEAYAFSSNDSQIKGFLGEIYNNAFLMYMADNGGDLSALERITPVGASGNFIDTWLRGFGIQVKNYEKDGVIKKGFRIHDSSEMGKFIKNTLQLQSAGTSNTASVADILLNFFTAYDFNEDYGKKDPSIAKTDGYEFWQQARARMDAKFKDEKAFTNIMMPYVDRIIGIDRSFKSKDANFIQDVPYFRNTFFNISGNYIPSSVLVQAIIDTINKDTGPDAFSQLMRVHFSAPTHTPTELDKWDAYETTDNQVAQVFNNREDYANASKVSYSITLDVNAFISNLEKWLF